MKTTTHTFKTFPEFSELTLADRDEWEELIADFPPISSISFADLMVWWATMDNPRVSLLNGNLVISYMLPGNEEATGLSIIGTNNIDESICTIFDYQREKGDSPKLIHVPEFVIASFKYPELYEIKGTRQFDECVLSNKALVDIDNLPDHKKEKIASFQKFIEQNTIKLTNLDLTNIKNQELLVQTAKKWETQGPFNGLVKHERESLERSVWYAPDLGIENICVFINDKLYAYLLFKPIKSKHYALIYYARFNSERNLFDYAVFKFAEWFNLHGIEYVNIEEDYGLNMLRAAKLNLAPVNFFRKYIIEPKT
jgi:hypothetical protein